MQPGVFRAFSFARIEKSASKSLLLGAYARSDETAPFAHKSQTGYSHAFACSRIGCGKGGESMTSGKRKKRTKMPYKSLLYGMLIGVGTIILLVLLLTLLVYLGWLPESSVSIGNTVIKILAALAAGTYVGLSRGRSPWWFGGIAAVLSLVLAIGAMSLYLGAFRLTWNTFADLLMSFAVGSAVSALLARRKTE